MLVHEVTKATGRHADVEPVSGCIAWDGGGEGKGKSGKVTQEIVAGKRRAGSTRALRRQVEALVRPSAEHKRRGVV